MQEEIIKIINTVLQKNILTKENIDDNLVKFGLDSLSMIQLIVNLEKKYNCEIPDSKIIFSKMDTVNKIIEILRETIENTNRGGNS